ncbi:MAG: type IV secretion system protein, partial [Phaeobacter italicus]
MRADTRIAAIIVAGTLMAAHPPPAFAQGVPVIDGSNLAQNIEQLQAALRDAENQLQQIEELRTQIERLTDIQGLLDDVLGSITGLNEIAALYNDVEDLRARAQKITDLSGFMDSLSLGDFDSLLDDLLDGDVTM